VSQKLLIYGGYIYAKTIRGQVVSALTITAYSLAEAVEYGIDRAKETWPEDQGCWAHHCSVVDVSEGLIAAVASHNSELD
jgi:hypothetical protein